MKRMLFCVLLGLAGCGANPFGDARMSVTPRLRDACRGLRDVEIQTVIDAVENDRLRGFTKQEQLDAGIVSCSTGDCIVCLNAIINQLYGF